MPSHSADRSSFRTTPVTAPTQEGAPATATDAMDVTDQALSVSGAYIYGYDSAGNPTLTDVGYLSSSDGGLPD